MPSDNDNLTAGQSGDNAPVDSGLRSPQEPRDDGLSASGHLTHTQRVERVNEYLRRAASNGVWSAIE